MTMLDYAEVQQDLPNVFNMALKGPVMINRHDGHYFTLTSISNKVEINKSPFEDIEGINTNITMNEILEAIHDHKM
jgi:hypothetical protein